MKIPRPFIFKALLSLSFDSEKLENRPAGEMLFHKSFYSSAEELYDYRDKHARREDYCKHCGILECGSEVERVLENHYRRGYYYRKECGNRKHYGNTPPGVRNAEKYEVQKSYGRNCPQRY